MGKNVKMPILANHPLLLFKYTDSKKCLQKSQDLGDTVSLTEAKSYIILYFLSTAGESNCPLFSW